MFWTPQQVPILVVIVYRWDESGSEPRLVKDLLYVITQDSKHHARVGPSFWQCSNLQNRRPHVCGHYSQPVCSTRRNISKLVRNGGGRATCKTNVHTFVSQSAITHNQNVHL